MVASHNKNVYRLHCRGSSQYGGKHLLLLTCALDNACVNNPVDVVRSVIILLADRAMGNETSNFNIQI